MTNKIEKYGAIGKRWTNYGKDRIYINSEWLQKIVGLELSFYKTGNISKAVLKGQNLHQWCTMTLLRTSL